MAPDPGPPPALDALDAMSAPAPDERRTLLGRTREELEELAVELGEPAYRGRQLFSALYRRRVAHLDAMTELPNDLRRGLEAAACIGRPTVTDLQTSADGTRKYRFVGQGDGAFEAVFIPEVARGGKTHTLCVSSQTGCSVGCTFCFTASLKRNRNLSAAEIVGQVLTVADDVESLEARNIGRVTNIVFMGMGEPLLNYRQVTRAVSVLMDADGADFSSRRITVSTAGIVPRIHDLGRDLSCQLAVSLNATTDEVRDRIMPINRKWKLAALTKALRNYPLARRRRITIEYVLLGGINDSQEDALRLPNLLAGIPVKVNLLPLNAHDRTEFEPPPPERVEKFQETLRRAGINAIIRTPRGHDIAAACGQLGETVVPAEHSGEADETTDV